MNRRALLLSVAALMASGCGDPGERRYSGIAAVSRHWEVDCTVCHASSSGASESDALPTCVTSSCHPNQETHPDPAMETETCLACHTAHESRNIFLVREEIIAPDGRVHPIVFTSLAGSGDGGFTSSPASGAGLCEVCHTATRFYRADGSGEAHFPYPCLTCHKHGRAFAP